MQILIVTLKTFRRGTTWFLLKIQMYGAAVRIDCIVFIGVALEFFINYSG